MKTETPRTDAITFKSQAGMMPPYDTVPAKFSQKLEQESNDWKQVAIELADVAGRVGYTSCGCESPEGYEAAMAAIKKFDAVMEKYRIK